MQFFETHAHLDDKRFSKDRDNLIKKCYESGISKIINVGCDGKSSLMSIKLSQKYDFIYTSVGYHPHEAKDFSENKLKILLRNKKIVAIGEIGLDYYRNLSPKKEQKKAFIRQIEIANDLNLPIIVHNREADEDCLEILKSLKPSKVVYHCFSSNMNYAEKLLEQGYFLSFTGNITYNNPNLALVVSKVPLEKIFIETDSPYLSPIPKRKERNSPLNLYYVAEKIAQIKELSLKTISEKTYQNAEKFFNV